MHILRHAHEVSAFIQTYPDQSVTTLIQQRLSDLLPTMTRLWSN